MGRRTRQVLQDREDDPGDRVAFGIVVAMLLIVSFALAWVSWE